MKNKKDAASVAGVKLEATAQQFAGLEATFPVDVEFSKGVVKAEDHSVTLKFEDEKVKRDFFKRVKKLDSERFVFRTDGALVLRSTSGSERGITGVFFQGGQGAVTKLYRVVAAREMAPRFATVSTEEEALALFNQYREALNIILSKDLKLAYPALAGFIAAKSNGVDAALAALKNSGQITAAANAVSQELTKLQEDNVNTPIELSVFTDDLGQAAQTFTAVSEGMSSVGQAITAALSLLGVEKGILSQLPTVAGQVGPATSPLIGGAQSRLGGKNTLYLGQIMSSIGNAVSTTSLVLGALGAISPMSAFAGMVGGIVVNGIAGNGVLKQSNVPLAKERANDPISASAIAADLNSWASVGGMYCYLFLPVVGGLTTLLFGKAVGLFTLAGMFGFSTLMPLISAVLMRASKIKNVKEENAANSGYWKTIGDNLKFGFNSPSLRKMVGRVALYHFAGMAFNSGPGAFFKAVFAADPTMAMIASFFAVYLTVFAGRKIGAKMMKAGQITDKALIGLSSMIALVAGGLSILPGLPLVARGSLWAIAGLGFANLANMEQAIELNRPANVGHKAAVSTMYVLARMSGMATIFMGMLSDGLVSLGLDSMEASIYQLALPWAALAIASFANRDYIKGDLKNNIKRWMEKTPKVLAYAALRKEVEEGMVKNPTWGTSMDAETSDELAGKLAAGIASRYDVNLSTLEEIRADVEDKAGLDIHRLEMARKLASRLQSNRSVQGQPLTYEAFREEVEPLYTAIVMGRATGSTDEDIDEMTSKVLDGILAKYTITDAEMDVMIGRLSRRTYMNRNRLSVLDKLYAIQLQKDATKELNDQLKNATDEASKLDIENHINEKYREIAEKRGMQWPLPN